jgi:DNA-binding transcriptional MerR regulator
MTASGYIRIGELSRRTGVSPELLRAWERRYGLFAPDRSPGRFRLFSDADVERVRAMREHIARGLSAAEAARLVVESPPSARASVESPGFALEEPRQALRAALLAFDEPGAHAAFDVLLARLTVDSLLREVVLPFLRDLGESWERGEATVAQEHFASNLLRGRLLALGRGWGRGTGSRALLAAPPGELHDLGLVALGLALRERGWRVTFLGADTPVDTLIDTARRLGPDVIVVASLIASRFEPILDLMEEVARRWPLVLAGAGVDPDVATRIGGRHVVVDPIEAADVISGDRVRAVG